MLQAGSERNLYKCTLIPYQAMETISLDVKGRVPEELLQRLYAEVTPAYMRGLLVQYHMPTDPDTLDTVLTSYESGFPTTDLALQAFALDNGVKFWGVASGGGSRMERMSVKYLILEHIQAELASAGFQSDLNIAGLNRETIAYMSERGMFKGKLTELRAVAKRLGNAGDFVIGLEGALATPVSVNFSP